MENVEQEKLKIEDVLEREGKYVGPTVGVSMLPMLKNRRDTVIISKKTERLKPYDVALYKRGKDYVLHRVLLVTDTGYIIRGDNCYSDEIVPEETVIGVLTEFYRKGKHIVCTDKKYLRYAKRHVKMYPLRRRYVLLKGGVKRLIKKMIGRK